MSLHWALLFVLVVKLGVELCAMFYWRLCDTTGHCYTELTYAERLLFAPLFESLFFALLLLVSKGWAAPQKDIFSSFSADLSASSRLEDHQVEATSVRDALDHHSPDAFAIYALILCSLQSVLLLLLDLRHVSLHVAKNFLGHTQEYEAIISPGNICGVPPRGARSCWPTSSSAPASPLFIICEASPFSLPQGMQMNAHDDGH